MPPEHQTQEPVTPPAAAPATRSPQPAAALVKISTSKLAAQLGVSSARALLERLTADGLLTVNEAGHVLTSVGQAAGGEFIEKSRYGPYFIWPQGLQLRQFQSSSGKVAGAR